MTQNGTRPVTPASGWKRQDETVTFPSGKVARLKKPDLIEVIMSDGSIPDALAGFMMSAAIGEVDESQISAKEMPAMLELANKICVAAFIEPRVVADREPDYDAGEINISDVAMADRFFLIRWAQGGQESGQGGSQAQTLAQFPEESDADVQPVSEVQDVPALS